jgi:hypothetical protein
MYVKYNYFSLVILILSQNFASFKLLTSSFDILKVDSIIFLFWCDIFSYVALFIYTAGADYEY